MTSLNFARAGKRAAFGLAVVIGFAGCSTDNVFGLSSASGEKTADLTSGPLELTVSGFGDAGESAKISVPAGAEVFAADGSALDNSSVTVEITVQNVEGSPDAETQTIADADLINAINEATGSNYDPSLPLQLPVTLETSIAFFADALPAKASDVDSKRGAIPVTRLSNGFSVTLPTNRALANAFGGILSLEGEYEGLWVRCDYTASSTTCFLPASVTFPGTLKVIGLLGDQQLTGAGN